jgi:hypothetical protein
VGVAQLVRASGCGPEGRGFESHHSPHEKLVPEKVGAVFTVLTLSLRVDIIELINY